jgi:hypothetical protein
VNHLIFRFHTPLSTAELTFAAQLFLVWVVVSSARYAQNETKAAGIATVVGVWLYDGL